MLTTQEGNQRLVMFPQKIIFSTDSESFACPRHRHSFFLYLSILDKVQSASTGRRYVVLEHSTVIAMLASIRPKEQRCDQTGELVA